MICLIPEENIVQDIEKILYNKGYVSVNDLEQILIKIKKGKIGE